MNPFQDALKTTLLFEGGYQNLKSDPGNVAPHGVGGGTNFGVTQATYDDYMESHDRPYKPVRFIAPSEVRSIYELEYWRPCGAPALLAANRPVLAACAFDWAVHGGVRKSRIFTQAAVGAMPDGVWGPRTLDAFSKAPDLKQAGEQLRLRAAHHWGRCKGSPGALAALTAARIPQMKGVWPSQSENAAEWLKGWLIRCRKLANAFGIPVHPSYADHAWEHDYPNP